MEKEVQPMHISVSVENSEFVRTLANALGVKPGDIIDSILTKYRADNQELEEQTTKFLALVKDRLPEAC